MACQALKSWGASLDYGLYRGFQFQRSKPRGINVSGLGFRVCAFGFRVSGFGFQSGGESSWVRVPAPNMSACSILGFHSSLPIYKGSRGMLSGDL